MVYLLAPNKVQMVYFGHKLKQERRELLIVVRVKVSRCLQLFLQKVVINCCITSRIKTAASYKCTYDNETNTPIWSKYGPDLSDCYSSLDYLIKQLNEGKNELGYINICSNKKFLFNGNFFYQICIQVVTIYQKSCLCMQKYKN